MTFSAWSLFLFPILAIILITMFPRFKQLLLLTDRQERGADAAFMGYLTILLVLSLSL